MLPPEEHARLLLGRARVLRRMLTRIESNTRSGPRLGVLTDLLLRSHAAVRVLEEARVPSSVEEVGRWQAELAAIEDGLARLIKE